MSEIRDNLDDDELCNAVMDQVEQVPQNVPQNRGFTYGVPVQMMPAYQLPQVPIPPMQLPQNQMQQSQNPGYFSKNLFMILC